MDDRRSVVISQRPRPRRWFLVRFATALILLSLPCACLAQSGRPAPDTRKQALTQAIREGRVVDAEKIATDAIHEIEQSDPDSPQLADYLRYHISFLDGKGRFSEAFALEQRILEIHRKALGPTDMEISNDLINLASSPTQKGNNQEIERLLKEALEIVRLHMTPNMSGQDVEMAARSLGSVAALYLTEHRWAEADPLLQEESKLCDLFEARLRAGYAMCESLPHRLAELYRAEGRGVDVAQMTSDDQHSPPELASLNRTAMLYEKDGLYPSAEDVYNQAIALAEKIEATPQNRFGGIVEREYDLLGQFFEKHRLNDKAEKAYATALEIREKTLGRIRGHSDYAGALNYSHLLDLYRNTGRLKDIEPVIQHVLEIQEQSLGERHRAVVKTLTEFAEVYKEEGQFAEAQLVYERALAIQEANLGQDDYQLIEILSPYADLLRKLKDNAKASEVQARIDVLQKRRER